MRRTKIVATLGPATESAKVVEEMLLAGVDVVRMNFSHGSPEDHKARAKLVRDASIKTGKIVSILGDLQGPKIRIDRFIGGVVEIVKGDRFVLDAELDKESGTVESVGLTYKALPSEVVTGDELLLDDGRLVLVVEYVEGQRIITRVEVGGKLSNNKGINRRNGGLSAEALTEKDKADIKLAAEIDVDFLAVSFPRSAGDIEYTRELLKLAGGAAKIVAKIERAEAVVQPALDEIIRVSDVIMVARGDLGVEIGDARLPETQKMLIKRSRELNTVVITATQMMESMIENPIPTRAEVFDVANAVMDGTDAVMLSGETATGAHPAKVIRAMSSICEEAEHTTAARNSNHRMDLRFERVDESIAMAAMYVANHYDIKAIAALTESGATAKWMSRISSEIAIYALTPSEKTCRYVNLYRGVYPVFLPHKIPSPMQANRIAVEQLLNQKIVQNGDMVIVTKGDLMGINGGTNMFKMIRVGDHEIY
ncbi:MAG: pyruvate kinase [Thiotrichaceae bacterium]|nr:pyruvate kinase [Thiotrichaceae bacterium]